MTGLFERLLRSNFRCGRMLHPGQRNWSGVTFCTLCRSPWAERPGTGPYFFVREQTRPEFFLPFAAGGRVFELDFKK